MAHGATMLNIQHNKVRIKGKWSNPRKGLYLSVVAIGSPNYIYIYIYISDKYCKQLESKLNFFIKN